VKLLDFNSPERVAARLGLGADTLRAANPRLVYCSISGFGQDGPFRDLPAYDMVVQAMSGLMVAAGFVDSFAGGGAGRVDAGVGCF